MRKAFWGIVAGMACSMASGTEWYTATYVEGRVSAADLNDKEEVVGGGGIAFYATAADVLEIFGALAGLTNSPYGGLYGINNRGVMVGSSLTGTNNTGPVRAFLLDRTVGVARDLGSLRGPSGGSAAWAINESNVIVGSSETTNGTHAVRFESDGTITDLGTLGGTSSVAYDINEGGEIVGESQNAAGEQRPFVIRGGKTMIDLGTLGGTWARARRINNKGEVVGVSTTTSGSHAFLWSQGVMRDLGTLPEYPASEALGINDDGVVVGRLSGPIGLAAFVWYPEGRMIKLGALVKLPPEEETYEALDINNSGVILVSVSHPMYRTAYGRVAVFRPGAAVTTFTAGQTQLKIGAPPGFTYEAHVDRTEDFKVWKLGSSMSLQGEQVIPFEASTNGVGFFRVSIKPTTAQ